MVGENTIDEAEFFDSQYVVILFEGQEDDEDCSLDLRKLTDFMSNIESAHNIWCYNYQLNLFCLPQDVLNKNIAGGNFQNDVVIFSPSERQLTCYRISQFFGKNRKIHNDSAIHDEIKADALKNIKRIIDNKMQYYTTRSSMQDGERLFQADDAVVAKNISATLKQLDLLPDDREELEMAIYLCDNQNMKYLIVYNNPSEKDETKDALFTLEGNFHGFQHSNHTGTNCHLQKLIT